MALESFSQSSYSSYPQEAYFLMKKDEVVERHAIPPDSLSTETVIVTLWNGGKAGFYEDIKPAVEYTQDKTITAQGYDEFLGEHAIPVSPNPDEWATAKRIHTENMEILTTLQYPVFPEPQARILNTTQQFTPALADVVPQTKTKEYVGQMTEAGFSYDAFRDMVMPDALEIASRKTVLQLRRLGLQPPSPDGRLTVAIRAANSRPDLKK